MRSRVVPSPPVRFARTRNLLQAIVSVHLCDVSELAVTAQVICRTVSCVVIAPAASTATGHGFHQQGEADAQRFFGAIEQAGLEEIQREGMLRAMTVGAGQVADWEYVGVCSSPAVEGKRLYYVSNRGELVCLDTEGFLDGNTVLAATVFGVFSFALANCGTAVSSPRARRT